ncbi:MAG: flagellar basal-body rod protein FlgG [Clostridiales bacterium]|jgi:flagellar basal-body rod protein FlgG|nr:flagellar basal-body rod protein FlgG [Clostridiales bacterium]
MMRSLWTAASGMSAQQMNVDLIANNLANVNTTAFKKERVEFQSLLYQTMRRATMDAATAIQGPTNLQVGLGVRPIAITRVFEMGNLERTDNNFDFAINGPGFFMIQRDLDTIAYTRDGTFTLSPMEGGGLMLVTTEGFPVLSIDGEPIEFGEELNMSTMAVGDDGTILFTSPEGEVVDEGIQIAIVQFPNPQGLEAIGRNLFLETPASGAAMLEADGETAVTSDILQGFLESSNVQLAEEMVRLIIAQRAYEVNSRTIQASDEMLQQANNLRR